MITILTEKPSAARNFARALGGKSGNYNGEEYRIVNSVGHIFGLAKPEYQVDEELVGRYRSWDIDKLPWNPDDLHWRRAKMGDTDKILSPIRTSFKDSHEVVIATDDDPSGEGELLAWEILEYLKWDGKVTRMYFQDETPVSIKKAFEERKEIESQDKDGDYVKAWARSRFDFLSMQHTRIATTLAQKKGYHMLIRQGRLKSVIVYLTGTQLDAYHNYTKKMFYEARYKDNNGHIYSRKDADDFRFDKKDMVDLSPYLPSEVVVDKTEKKHTIPGKLLDLAGLSSILASDGVKPAEVLSVYQNMYEDHVVSYPRTEDKNVTFEQFKELLPYIDKIADAVGVDKSLLTHRKPRPSHVKDSGSHGANRPGINVPDSLDALEARYGTIARKIYKVLALNYLAMFGEDYEYNKQTGHIKDHPEFIGTANIPLKQGFKAIFDSNQENEEETEQNLPLGTHATSFVYEGCNKRPPRPTVRWLVNKLEKYNVGTGATRTSTIAEVTKPDKMTTKNPCQLMKETKGVLTLTDIGDISYKLLKGTQIADVKITEDLFNQMDDVGKFKIIPEVILQSATRMVVNDLDIMKRNAMHLPEGKKKSEKVEGVFVNENTKVVFNRIWAGHRFTDEEVESLLQGDTITFEGTYDSGGKYIVSGVLARQEYKGRAFYGFMKTGSPDRVKGIFVPQNKAIEFKRKWGEYEFSQDDIDRLLQGETITIQYPGKDGTKEIEGSLKEQTYKKAKFWGFAPDMKEDPEKTGGVYVPTNKVIEFKRKWGSYEFTKEDIENLLKGETITIQYQGKDGTKEIKGCLKEQNYKKRKFWGFAAIEGDRPDRISGKYKGKKQISFKNSWGGHTFTDEETDLLLQGEYITFETTFKSGKKSDVTGRLEEKTYKGKKFWGFEPDFG